MSGIGPEIPAGSDDHELVARIVRAVERLSGRPSRWNGRLFEENLGSARALDDGGMAVSVPLVVAQLRLAASGRPLTEADRLMIKDAVLTVVHEAEHLTHHLGDENAPGAVPVYSADALALEEGLTETWALRHVDAVIQETGLDQQVPGLLETKVFNGYAANTAATDAWPVPA
jgi:hypothetical protein